MRFHWQGWLFSTSIVIEPADCSQLPLLVFSSSRTFDLLQMPSTGAPFTCIKKDYHQKYLSGAIFECQRLTTRKCLLFEKEHRNNMAHDLVTPLTKPVTTETIRDYVAPTRKRPR